MMSIWLEWCKINYELTLSTIEEIWNMPIWGNSQIRRQNKPIFDSQIMQSNVNKIFDLCHPGGGWMSPDDLHNEYSVNFQALYLMGIIAAIPNRWKVELCCNPINVNIDCLLK